MTELAPKSLEAWQLVQSMLTDMRAAVVADAEDETELLEGLRVLGRITALASEVALDGDPARPWLLSMDTPARFVGGPNPDGEYLLGMIDGTRRYRVHGRRGTSAYLGFQVLAGVGLTPRRMAAHVSDRDLALDADGGFALVLAATEPTSQELAGATWVEIPQDASALVVREYVADRATEVLAELAIDPVDPPGPPARPTDEQLAEQLTSWAWTIAKLATLHRTIKPELMDLPNQLVSAAAAELGAADTTPDNLYMIGTFRLAPGEALELEIEPPASRYWSVTLESIWHECLEPRRRRSSLTNASAVADADGKVRVLVCSDDPGTANWLDAGGRHRGFVILRWLDRPEAPAVTTRVVSRAGAPS
ncbi:MAG TPA: DUF1214 domain-containing protein [Mycobacteriales bacterium]|nr:DUF1214 domain-containing protein [Mycobacteriales bacterium]